MYVDRLREIRDQRFVCLLTNWYSCLTHGGGPRTSLSYRTLVLGIQTIVESQTRVNETLDPLTLVDEDNKGV